MRIALYAFVSLCLSAAALGAPAPGLNYVLLDPRGNYSGANSGTSEALGSLWKLFVYTYIVETQQPAPGYLCRGEDKEEAFCCEKGKTIGLEDALKKSCGPFFAPARLGISTGDWRKFWKDNGFDDWLLSLGQMKPGTRIPLRDLLGSLRMLRALPRFPVVETSLLQVILSGTGSVAAREFGGLLRAKTFTWNAAESTSFEGGFAGYLQDGSAIWFKSHGSSRQALRENLHALLPVLSEHQATSDDGCVLVRHVSRYPIRGIIGESGATPRPGPLHGTFTLKFQNGNHSSFRSNGQITLTEQKGAPTLLGRYSVVEYVARVLEREVTAYPAEASKAMAILARTYLFANATRAQGCFVIEDSTHAQRVSMDPPSATALGYAAFTSPLVLSGITPRYHLDPRSPGVLSLRESLRLAAAGYQYDEILTRFFPAGKLAPAGFLAANESCRDFDRARHWLARHSRNWESRLRELDGFESPRPELCRSKNGKAFSDPDSQRIYLTSFGDTEDELSLAHEYLHLAFQHHPRGLNEAFIEQTAQSLLRSGVNE